MAETIKNSFLKQNFLNLIIFNSISKIGNGQVVENLFPEKTIHDLSET